MPAGAADELRRRFGEIAGAGGADAPRFDLLDPRTLELLLDLLHPEVEFVEDPMMLEPGTYRGREGVRGYQQTFAASFARLETEIEELLQAASPDEALAIIVSRAEGRGSGALAELRAAWLFTVRDGLIVRVRTYVDRAAGYRAAGIER